jgi:hypothetical protein
MSEPLSVNSAGILSRSRNRFSGSRPFGGFSIRFIGFPAIAEKT